MKKLLGFGLMIGLLIASPVFATGQSQDEKVQAEIQNKIYHTKSFNRSQIQVSYNQGVVTLTGTVTDLGAKLDAERAARKVKGVESVVDQVTVDTEDIKPAQMLEAARHAVVMYPRYGIFDNIELSAQGNTLVVSGQVTQPYKKSDLGAILSHVPGVAGFENDLEVLPTSIFDDQIRFRVARAIYSDPLFVYYRNQAIPPIHIIVKNGNVRLVGVVASQLDRSKAEMDARLAATYFGLTNDLRVSNS
jgi:osmotically-inducible protein OsmY